MLAELKRRGWTDALIRELVGQCDLTSPNPWYRSAPRLKLYLKTRIYEIEATKEFSKFQERARARQESAARAVETRTDNLHREIRESKAHVPLLSREELIRRACNSWNNHKVDLACEGRIETDEWHPASAESELAFLDRISVNYVRHELTGYERKLRARCVGVRRSALYLLISRKAFEAIAATYPHLAEECERQMKRREAMYADDLCERGAAGQVIRLCPICHGHGMGCQVS